MYTLIAGAGDVGQRVAEKLAAVGDPTLLLRRSAPTLAQSAERRWLQADLTVPDSLQALPDEVRSVVYLPSPDDRSVDAYRAVYLDGLRNLIAAVPQLERLVLVTSTAVLGYDDGRWVDEATPTRPATPTAEVLVEAEQLAASAGPPATSIVRLAGIYGPGRTRLLDDVAAGTAQLRPEPVFTNRIHADDAAGVLALLLRCDDPPSVVIGVDDDPAPRSVVLAWLAEQLGVPAPSADLAATERRRGGNKRCRSVELSRLGYAHRYPTFREGYGELLDRR